MAASKKKTKTKKRKTSRPKTAAKKKSKAKKTPKKKVVSRKTKKIVKSRKRVVTRRKRPSLKKKLRPLDLRRVAHNPVMSPDAQSYWESEAVFNPGAVMHGGRIHLFYRALGPDGVSRIGYASSKDGVNFDKRFPHPVYMPERVVEDQKRHPYTSPARLEYDRALYVSGGGWGGCEDPRAVKIDGRVYMTFNVFNGWNSIRVGLTSISEEDLEREHWRWKKFVFLSPDNQRHKSWVLFPEKINGKYAIFHNLHDPDPNKVGVELVDSIDKPLPKFNSPDPQQMPSRELGWHNRTRGAGPPPVKTKYGWLLFYHAMDKNDPDRYKLGVLLLDSDDPRKILYRSKYPILEPDEWYENDWKPGIIYASGAIVKGNTLYIYYGGGDKHIGVAYTNLDDFVKKLRKNEHAVFSIKSAQIE